ncbi:MAG TPA: NAD(P)-dependent oxidoreductase [Solirubrobacteraceae bacterium]|nr:NAD(P)-dependent oxidoreductase [Solirubrobacteraceae bacterium]
MEAAERVGFMGLGTMGSRMAANVASSGRELMVWTHTPGKAERWAGAHGAAVAGSPAELAAACDVLVTMVVDGAQVASLLLDGGALDGAQPGLLCVDMSTIDPRDTLRIGAALAERSVRFLDAPVTGSAPRAADATLTIMAGGDHADFERALPLLETMGRTIVHVGPLGAGERVKLINNALAAANAAALAQALVLAQAEDLERGPLLAVLAAGSGASTMLALKAEPMLDGDYEALFKTDHMLKDVALCLAQAERAGVAFPAAADALRMLELARQRGYGSADFAAIFEAAKDPAP